MKLHLESTSKVVQLNIGGVDVPARVWQGETGRGVAVVAFITRIAVERDEDQREFEEDLEEHAPPSFSIEAWPLRMFVD